MRIIKRIGFHNYMLNVNIYEMSQVIGRKHLLNTTSTIGHAIRNSGIISLYE